MSRKTPSFGQLASYMSSEKSDDRYDLHHNCFARGEDDIARAFLANSKLLQKRKNGNYLYHEILSISLEAEVDRSHAKDCLRKIALEYIEARCPRNMVYGCLHEDHAEHLHYHLMISANQQHESKRFRLTTKQFDGVKRNLENHILENYPELKQRRIITADNSEKKLSRKASEQKRRTGKLERQEMVSSTIRDAMSQTSSFANFKFFLNERNYSYYVRGKNHGVEVGHESGKIAKYRFSTLGLHEEFEHYLDTITATKGAQEAPQSGQNTSSEPEVDGREEAGSEAREPHSFPQDETGNNRSSDETSNGASEKSTFAREVENIHEKKRQKKARMSSKKLERKPRKR